MEKSVEGAGDHWELNIIKTKSKVCPFPSNVTDIDLVVLKLLGENITKLWLTSPPKDYLASQLVPGNHLDVFHSSAIFDPRYPHRSLNNS